MPHINADGLALIQQYEGDRLRSYPDPGTGGAPWTIGYGHTVDVHPGEAITQAEAVGFLRSDVDTAEDAVEALVEVVLTPNQFAGLVSFQYNTGALAGSNLLACVNQEDWAGAVRHLELYVYAGGHVLPGLVARRQAEARLFQTP